MTRKLACTLDVHDGCCTEEGKGQKGRWARLTICQPSVRSLSATNEPTTNRSDSKRSKKKYDTRIVAAKTTSFVRNMVPSPCGTCKRYVPRCVKGRKRTSVAPRILRRVNVILTAAESYCTGAGNSDCCAYGCSARVCCLQNGEPRLSRPNSV